MGEDKREGKQLHTVLREFGKRFFDAAALAEAVDIAEKGYAQKEQVEGVQRVIDALRVDATMMETFVAAFAYQAGYERDLAKIRKDVHANVAEAIGGLAKEIESEGTDSYPVELLCQMLRTTETVLRTGKMPEKKAAENSS